MSTITEDHVRVRINGFDVEAAVPDIRTILGLDPDTGGMQSIPTEPTENVATTKSPTKRTTKPKEQTGDEAKADSENSVDVDMDAVIQWLIDTGQRKSAVGRKPNAEAIRAYLEAKGKKKAA